MFLQMMGPDQVSDLVASEGDQNDWLWKAVRKGVAPAFAPHALRYHSISFRSTHSTLKDAVCTDLLCCKRYMSQST